MLRFLTKAGHYTVEHLRLNRMQLVNHRLRQAEVLGKCRELRTLIQDFRIPPHLADRIREELATIENWYNSPRPPYEPGDLAANKV